MTIAVIITIVLFLANILTQGLDMTSATKFDESISISFQGSQSSAQSTSLRVHNIDTGLNYSTIQEAIDAPETLDGHTIWVDVGSYKENVKVYKELKITSFQALPAEGHWISWPMFHHNAQRNGTTIADGPDRLGLLWEFDTGYPIGASPVVGSDGTVYIGSQDRPPDVPKLYAIYPFGVEKWRFETTQYGQIWSSPVIGKDGTIYIVTTETDDTGGPDFFAVNPDGTEKWHLTLPDDDAAGGSSLAITDEAGLPVIYFGSMNGYLYRIEDLGTTGNIAWARPIPPPVGLPLWDISPAIGPDGTIYIGCKFLPILFAFNPDGSSKWVHSFSTVWPTTVYSPAVEIVDGRQTIYVGIINTTGVPTGKIYALLDNPKALKWVYDVEGPVRTCPAIRDLNGDGKVEIVFGADDHFVYAVSDLGINNPQLLWKFQTGGAVVSSPSIDETGTVYVGSNDGYIYAINGEDGALLSSFKTFGPSGVGSSSPAICHFVSSPPIVPTPNRVYICSSDGRLYALRERWYWPEVTASDPNDHVFHVIANNVTIEGFMITGATGPGKCGVYLDGVNRCEVSSNIITGNGWGIVLRGSNRNTILGNVLYSLPADGISVRDFSQHNRIINNLLNFNHYGITVLNASNYNLISGNFVNSSDWSGIRLNWFGGGFEPLTDNNITNNILDGNSEGIFLDSPSSNNLVSGNSISNNGKGIRLRQSHNNTIVHNTVTSNAYGAYLESCYNNLIYDNLFENTNNAWDNGANCWNTSKHAGLNIVGGPNIGGNYWMDIVPDPDPEPHIDLDVDDDGLLDYAYNITGDNNRDYLPLVVHDIAVKNVAPSKTVIKKGESVSIIVTVENQGDCVENFSVTVYAARDIIAIRDVTVARRTSLNLEFVWKTRGFATGNYAISAKATPVPPETDTIDNTYIDGCVALTSPVGGVWIPTDKLSLLAPYVALVSTIAVAATATAIYIKRKKKRR